MYILKFYNEESGENSGMIYNLEILTSNSLDNIKAGIVCTYLVNRIDYKKDINLNKLLDDINKNKEITY